MKKIFIIISVVIILSFLFISRNSLSADKKKKILPQKDLTTVSKEEWKEILTSKEYKIIFEQGTEFAYTGDLLNNKKKGVYVTAACQQPVFSSEHKYDSKTGWPSFWKPISDDAVKLVEDRKLGVLRWEVIGTKCNEHLGHVFEDGPAPTGKRYCINSLALDFIEDKSEED